MNPHLRTLLSASPLLLAATPALARHGVPTGAVDVVNQSGGTVSVALTGQPPMRLVPGQRATLYGPAGEASVRATYVQFGSERLLETEQVWVSPRYRATVVLEPEDAARVLVTNATPELADLVVGGQRHFQMAPGQSRLVTVPVGFVDVELRAGGRVLDELALSARPFYEHRWVAELPPTGDLLVKNPLPIPVELVCDRGLVRTVPAYGSTVYEDLPPGPFHLTARRVSDEVVDSATLTVQPGRRVDWRVDAPSKGLVQLDSEHWLSSRVFVDDRLAKSLAPEQDARVELPLGWHRVLARDSEGRVLADTWIEVEPYDLARVAFGVDRYALADARDDRGRGRGRDHDDDHGRDDGDDGHDGHEHAPGAHCHLE